MYHLKQDKALLEFETSDFVFKPTGTTTLLLEAVKQQIDHPGMLLDLGCGIGVVGIALVASGKVKMPLYASDISKLAVDLIKKNAVRNNCEIIARNGKLFDPWHGYHFDYIVDDVSGVAEDIAAISGWFKNISCESGYDGTELTKEVIIQSTGYLAEYGKLFFPVLSLSDTKKIISTAKNSYRNVKLVGRKIWPFPEDLKSHMSLLLKMKEEGVISFEEKFGIFTWSTDIYMAHN